MPDIDTTRESRLGRDIGVLRYGAIRWRSVCVLLLLLGVVLMAILPPLLNVNRLKRRVVTSISKSIGRPVHLDSVSLVLLPLPGFKLSNFVVAEDPAFGSEPVIHASSVTATLRISSLWRRRVEFSRINLEEPSINLVYIDSPSPEKGSAGRWNIESILLQAARISAAPTAQTRPSGEPRFPYIEATGARVNFKSGLEKLPFSLTEADFAVWLPNPREWRIRVEAQPTRTDTDASDTGSISLEASLGHDEHFDAIPLELSAEWKNAPLGEASRVLTGRDAGLRGNLRLSVTAKGTLGSSLIKSSLELREARRADFVPDHPLDLRAECQAISANTFQAFHQVRCAWPPAPTPTIGIASAAKAYNLIAITGDVPDVRRLSSASFEIGTPGLPAATLLNWLRIASPRVPPDLTAAGTLTGKITFEPGAVRGLSGVWNGRLEMKGLTVNGGPLGSAPIEVGPIALFSASAAGFNTVPGDSNAALHAPTPVQRKNSRSPNPLGPQPGQFWLAPTTLTLGGKDPATIEARFDPAGYALHLVGNVLPSRLLAFATTFPQVGGGLDAALPLPDPHNDVARPELPVHVDLTSSRPWFGVQTWSKVSPPVTQRPSRRHRRARRSEEFATPS